MEKQKMFSILIPCYNTEKYVKDCIESVLKQNGLQTCNTQA